MNLINNVVKAFRGLIGRATHRPAETEPAIATLARGIVNPKTNTVTYYVDEAGMLRNSSGAVLATPVAAPILLAFDGDSLLTTPVGHAVPDILQTNNPLAEVVTYAAGGRAQATQATGVPIGAAHYASNSRQKQIFITTGGVQVQIDLATCQSNTQTLVTAILAAGLWPVIGTVPKNNAFSSPQDLVRIAWNAWVVATYPANQVANIAASAHADQTNDTTWYSDGSHPTAALVDEWVAIYQATINSIPPNQTKVGSMAGQSLSNISVTGGNIYGLTTFQATVVKVPEFTFTGNSDLATHGIPMPASDGTVKAGIWSFANGGDLIIRGAGGNVTIQVWDGGTGGTNVANFTNTGNLTLTGTTLNTAAKTPASAAAAGTANDMCHDAGFIYICTATNTWKRVAIATW